MCVEWGGGYLSEGKGGEGEVGGGIRGKNRMREMLRR